MGDASFQRPRSRRERSRELLRAEALESLRLPDVQLQTLARLGREAAEGTYGRAFGPDTSEEEMQRLLQEDRERERQAQEEFRQNVLEREIGAYISGAESATDRESQRAYAARSIVLFLVVLAVVLMPVVAIFKGLDPDSFGTYIAPITGIAGTVVGFWFSTVDRTSGKPD